MVILKIFNYNLNDNTDCHYRLLLASDFIIISVNSIFKLMKYDFLTNISFNLSNIFYLPFIIRPNIVIKT